MLTGHEVAASRRPRSLARVYDAADAMCTAAAAVRAVPTNGVRALDGIPIADTVDAVRAKLLTPSDLDALANPNVLRDPVRSTHLAHIARSIFQDGVRDAEQTPGSDSISAMSGGVRALVAHLGGDALAAALDRDRIIRHACLRYGTPARCRVAVSTAIDAAVRTDTEDAQSFPRTAVADLAAEPDAPSGAGVLVVSALQERTAVGAIARAVAEYSRPDGKPLPAALEGALLAVLRHDAAWRVNATAARENASTRQVFNQAKHDALSATSDLTVLERAVRSDLTPLQTESHLPALNAALRVHAKLMTPGHVGEREIASDAVLFSVAQAVVESPMAPESSAYGEAVERLAGAAIVAATLYQNAKGGSALMGAAGRFLDAVAHALPGVTARVANRWGAVPSCAMVAVGASGRVGDSGEGSAEWAPALSGYPDADESVDYEPGRPESIGAAKLA